ncbi:MAG TPA: energy transducer TonB [Sandaracinaceae bacterium LLY-WYZ-13_1]|nr:energy transducer TonB [Sandaracinaceae bacterium LLY-WYZ-13_1]
MPPLAALVVALLALVAPATAEHGRRPNPLVLVAVVALSLGAHAGFAALLSAAPAVLALLGKVALGVVLIGAPIAIGRSVSETGRAVFMMVLSAVAHVGLAWVLGAPSTLAIVGGQVLLGVVVLATPLTAGRRALVVRLYALMALSVLVHFAAVAILEAPSWFFWLAGLALGGLLILTSPIVLGRSLPFVFRLYLTLALSLGGHLAVGLFYQDLPTIVEEPADETVEMEVLEPEPEPEPVVRERDPLPQPEPPPEETPPPEEPPPAEEAIADFTGETLTNEEGPTWSSETGSGEAMEGPIGQPGATVTGRRRRGQQGGRVGGTGEGEDPGPRIVPVGDLSRPPGIRDVDRLRRTLQDNYPSRARELGIEGTARVRIRVRADGRVQPLAVLSESYEGFGQACRQTLRRGGRFEPPLDRNGEPVDTITAFTCTFQVRF